MLPHGGRSDPRAHARTYVAAAILLVADGRYSTVAVANLPDAARLAADLAPDAARRGIEVRLRAGAPRSGLEIRGRRR